MVRLFLALTALSLLLAGCSRKPSAPAPAYQVRWHVPAKPGQKRDVEITTEQGTHLVMKKDGRIADDTTKKNDILFHGEIETSAVNERGQETKVTIRVKQLKLTMDGKENVVLQPGSVVVAEAIGSTARFTHEEGGAVEPKIAQVLAILFPLDTGDSKATTLFSTDQRRSVGDSWEADKAVAARQIKTKDAPSPAEITRATAKLTAMVPVASKDHLDLEYTLAYKRERFSQDPTTAAPGMEALRTSYRETATARFPADYLTGPVQTSHQSDSEMLAQGKPGTQFAGLVSEFTHTQRRRDKINYLNQSPTGPKEKTVDSPKRDKTVDLLMLIDANRDAIAGKWSSKGKTLVSPPNQLDRLQIPYIPPDEYDLLVVVERKEGNDTISIVPPWVIGGAWHHLTLGLSLGYGAAWKQSTARGRMVMKQPTMGR